MTQCDFDFRPVGPGRGRPCQENGGLGEFLRLSGAPPPAPCGGGPPRPERDQSRMKSKESQAPTRVSDSGESCNVTCSKCERGSDATRSCRGVCEGCRNDVRIVIRNPKPLQQGVLVFGESRLLLLGPAAQRLLDISAGLLVPQ